MRQYVPVQPALLSKFQLAAGTFVYDVAVHVSHVHCHAWCADHLPTLRTVGLLFRMVALLMTVKRSLVHEPIATLGTHVWFLARMGSHMVPQQVR